MRVLRVVVGVVGTRRSIGRLGWLTACANRGEGQRDDSHRISLLATLASDAIFGAAGNSRPEGCSRQVLHSFRGTVWRSDRLEWLAMKGVKAIVLVALVRTASADPAPKVARECKPTGGVLVEVAQRVQPKTKLPTATTRLYDSGAWKTVVIDVDGKLARTRSGCLEPSDVDSIREKLLAAKWKTTRSNATCRVDQPRFTTYKWKSRLLYTERTCNIDVLDEDSQRALDVVEFHLRVPLELDGGGLQRECLSNPLAKGCD
jgi:hypothetical protein